MRATLIAIDLIEDYFDAGLWPESVIPELREQLVASVNTLTAGCRARGIPVIWFRQEFAPDLSNAFRHMVERGMRYAIRGTTGGKLLPELDLSTDDLALEKTRYSAFYKTPLDQALAERRCDTVILAGITTAWCVRSTAVDAYQRDLQVVVASDATAGFSTAEHDESIAAMGRTIGRCMTVAEILELLDQP